jgi:hypothetical protein
LFSLSLSLSLSLSPSLFFSDSLPICPFFIPLPFLEALRWPFIWPNKRWFFSTSLPSWDEDKSCWGVSLLLGLGHQQSCHGWTVGDGFRSEIQRRVVGWGRPDWFENRGRPNGLYFPRVELIQSRQHFFFEGDFLLFQEEEDEETRMRNDAVLSWGGHSSI